MLVFSGPGNLLRLHFEVTRIVEGKILVGVTVNDSHGHSETNILSGQVEASVDVHKLVLHELGVVTLNHHHEAALRVKDSRDEHAERYDGTHVRVV